MLTRFSETPFKSSTVSVLITFAVLAVSASAQDTNWTIGHTIDGQPDLQGVWANNTINAVCRK